MYKQKDKKLLRAIATEEGRRRIGFDPDDMSLADLASGKHDSLAALQEACDHEQREQITALVDVLQPLGLPVVDASRAALALCREVKPRDRKITVTELYGRGSIVTTAGDLKHLGIRGIRALDLQTFRPDGQRWDFNRR